MDLKSYLRIKQAMKVDPAYFPGHVLYEPPSTDIRKYARDYINRRLEYLNRLRNQAFAMGFHTPSSQPHQYLRRSEFSM